MTDLIPCKHGCGKSLSTRGGIYKHEQKCHMNPIQEPQETVAVEDSTVAMTDIPPSQPDSEQIMVEESSTAATSSWMDFDMGEPDDNTDVIPTTLKVVAAQKPPKNPKKMSPKEKEALKSTNLALLKMGLTGADALIQTYGRKVCDDPELVVKHSDKDKSLVAQAQWDWMSENDIILSTHISTGVIAGALTAHYLGAPIIRIQKNAKTPLSFAGGRIGGFFRRLPLIGRLFGKKKKKQPMVIPVMEDEEEWQ